MEATSGYAGGVYLLQTFTRPANRQSLYGCILVPNRSLGTIDRSLGINFSL